MDSSPDPSVEQLIEQLSDASAQVRLQAVETLRRRKEASALPKLLPLLHDPDWWVRVAVADAVGELGDETTAQALLPDLQHDDPLVRSSVTLALGRLRYKPNFETALAMLEDITTGYAMQPPLRWAS